jgi:phosphoribosylformylglycinamidine synthase
MGAAGITSSASEMAGRSGNGVEIDMELVPIREPGMTPYEILLSESQERMLVVAKSGSENVVRDILAKWELEAEEIGRVTDDGLFRVLEGDRVVAEIPSLPLTEGCPTYEREGVESEEIGELRCTDLTGFNEADADQSEAFLKLMGSPNIASKQWIYGQYDTTVRTGTAVRPGGDAGVVRLRGTRRAVAATTDCNGRYVYLNPRSGTLAAVAEAARNLVCVGALPTAVTNNLNFGNPLKPHIYYQFRESVLALAEACKLFETPVTGGNVSFYNETSGAAIYPTPVIGMVGVLEDVDHITRHAFQNVGDTIILLGDNTDELGASEYLYVVEGLVAGEPPKVDLLGERGLQHAVLAMIRNRLLHSAHDVSEGGLACALAESALGSGESPFGVQVTLHDAIPVLPLLFGEAQGRIVVSCDPRSADEVLVLAKRHGVPCRAVGQVVSSDESFRIDGRTATLEADVEILAEIFFGTIPNLMDGAGPS